MSINAIQFQPGLSMAQFIQTYGTEAKCYRVLYKARWPQGFLCPCCQNRSRSRFRREGRIYYQCRACRHQTTLVSGTLFQNTKLSLTTWFLALYLLTSTKTNLSALELKRHLGVNYKAAWRLKHKVMQGHGRTRGSPPTGNWTTPIWAGNATAASAGAGLKASRLSSRP